LSVNNQQQNELLQVAGPSTSPQPADDGQGDRLRSEEQAAPSPVVVNDAQDLVGGLSSLTSDGSQDYFYLQPGNGQAPVAAFDPSASSGRYLATDDLGSVRLATDPADLVIGAGAYDVWGNYRPNTADAQGQVLLAGLHGSSPFGFTGQYYDAGAGTYAMRARQYDPKQGRFLNKDPHQPDLQLPVTLDPYEYSGNMPSEITDPSGQNWVWPYNDFTLGSTATIRELYQEESLIGGSAPWKSGGDGDLPTPAIGLSALTGSPAFINSHATEYWVPVFTHAPFCGHLTVDMHASLQTNGTLLNQLQEGTREASSLLGVVAPRSCPGCMESRAVSTLLNSSQYAHINIQSG
jgi:RHS repeat-associated protein